MGKGGGSAADFYLEMQMDGHGYDSEGDWDPSRAYDEMITAATVGESSGGRGVSRAAIAEIAEEIHLMAWEEEKEKQRNRLLREDPQRDIVFSDSAHRAEHFRQAEQAADANWLHQAMLAVQTDVFGSVGHLTRKEKALVADKLELIAQERGRGEGAGGGHARGAEIGGGAQPPREGTPTKP